MNKKPILCILAALMLLTACSNKELPKNLDSYIEANSDSQSDDSGAIDAEIITFDEIPDNYKNIEGNIFAVVEDGEIVGYKYGTKKAGKWTFVDCDDKGNIKEKPKKSTTTTTTTTTTTSSVSTTSQSESVSSSVSTTTTTKTVSTPSTTRQATSQSTQKTTTKATTKATSATAKSSSASTTQSVAFSYKFINGLAGLPNEVYNTFYSYIEVADIGEMIFQTKKSKNGKLYAMIYVNKGAPIQIRSVTNKGVITYKLGSGKSSGEQIKIVELTGYSGTITFNKG